MPTAKITQCTDRNTEKINDVDDVFVLDEDASNLMTFRLRAFSLLGLEEPAVYLDTDILITKSFSLDQLLSGRQIAICKRTFGQDDFINPTFKGMDLSEYTNKTFGEIYPYLASFNATITNQFWTDCSVKLLTLDPKFHFWYGDQEAMREVIKTQKFSTKELPESLVSCLPEHVNPSDLPLAVHFKGPRRKNLMMAAAKQLGLT